MSVAILAQAPCLWAACRGAIAAGWWTAGTAAMAVADALPRRCARKVGTGARARASLTVGIVVVVRGARARARLSVGLVVVVRAGVTTLPGGSGRASVADSVTVVGHRVGVTTLPGVSGRVSVADSACSWHCPRCGQADRATRRWRAGLRQRPRRHAGAGLHRRSRKVLGYLWHPVGWCKGVRGLHRHGLRRRSGASQQMTWRKKRSSKDSTIRITRSATKKSGKQNKPA